MTGNKMIDTILVALLSLASIGTLSLFVYTEIVYHKPLPNEEIENAKLKDQMKKKSFSESYKIKKMIINIPQKGSRLRFLEIEPNLLTFKSKTLDHLDQFKPEVKDAILRVTSKIKPDILNTVTGKILLEAKLKEAINKILGYQGVKEILFTRFVVQ